MKKLLPFVIAALMIPGVALAKGPNPKSPQNHTNHGKTNVQYILHGTLSAYTAFDSTTTTNGSITLTVTHANRHGRVLKGQSLTFMGMVAANTKVVLSDGVTMIADGDQGIVKIRAPKEPRDISASDLTALLTGLPVRQIIDQGASS